MSQPKIPDIACLSEYKTISHNLRDYRNKLEMTQMQIADLANCSPKYLSLLENSCFNNPPSLQLLFDLANVLQIQPYQLFKPLK